MNPLHLSGFGLEILTSNAKPHAELMIQDGRSAGNLGDRHLFLPRKFEHDSIVVENGTGHISLGALRWLSRHNIPIFFLDFDGSTISQVLPAAPIKADLRVAQIRASVNQALRFKVAHALVEAKIQRSLEVLDLLAGRYHIEKEKKKVQREARRLSEAVKFDQLLSVEAHVARKYWEAYQKAMPQRLRFEGRLSDSRNNNATDPVNAALNYGYGFLKVECRTAINTVGLEPAVGFLHETSSQQTAESLVYDLEEPFRFLVDLTVVKAFESGWLNVGDFEFTRDDYLYRLRFEAKERFLLLLRQRFNSGVEYGGRTLKYDTLIEEKAVELARYLTGRSRSLSFETSSSLIRRHDSAS